MNRNQVFSLLSNHREEILRRFSVQKAAHIGSAARDEMREGSDVDMLVEFQGPATFDGYMDLKFFLEDLFGTKVDLVTIDAVKPRMRPIIEKDLINVA